MLVSTALQFVNTLLLAAILFVAVKIWQDGISVDVDTPLDVNVRNSVEIDGPADVHVTNEPMQVQIVR